MDRIGLIGFGRFGKLLYRHISETVQVSVHDPRISKSQQDPSIPFSNLEAVCQNPLVILATPVSALENVTREIASLISPGTIVMDVCAVKEYPIKIMNENLPGEAEILGTHPLFGPDSAHNSLDGHLMIMTPYRIKKAKLKRIKNFWKGFGIKVIEMSADKQDKLMAWTLALTHFLGRGLNDLPLPDTTISTKDYQNLLAIKTKINRDTWELFQDMHKFNAYTSEMRSLLLKSMADLKADLDQLDKNDWQLTQKKHD